MQLGSSCFEMSGNESLPTAANSDPVALLGGSITVRLWSFTHILRDRAAKSARGPEALVIMDEASYCGPVRTVRCPWEGRGGGVASVAGALITYTHRVVRRWRLSITGKKNVFGQPATSYRKNQLWASLFLITNGISLVVKC